MEDYHNFVSKWKTTPIFFHMEDNLNLFSKVEDDLHFYKWMEDDLNFQMEDDLNCSDGRQPSLLQMDVRRPQFFKWKMMENYFM